MKNTSWKWRAWLTLALLCIAIGVSSLYSTAQPTVEAQAAVAQVNGGDAAYVTSQYVFKLRGIMFWSSVLVLVAVWVPWFLRNKYVTYGCEEETTCTSSDCTGCKCGAATGVKTLMCLLAGLVLVGCKPAKIDVYETVGPSETAFVIPLIGDTAGNQTKFNSVEYLNAKKVGAKRIPIPQIERKVGRMYWDIEWMPAVAVFRVDRSLVSREWVEDTNKGTRNKNEGIPVATKDSIQLTFGIAVTTFIEEEDASAYLYFHGLQKLSEVTDNNVRNFCVSELTRECGSLTLAELKEQTPRIFAKLYTDAKAYFKTKGITISQLGNAEGYQFLNPTIQESINQRFIAEQSIQTAMQSKQAQDETNKKLLATAETQAAAAKKLFEVQEATKLQNQLEVQMIQAKAALTMAEKWDGHLPANILPANSPMLMNLGTTSASTNTVAR